MEIKEAFAKVDSFAFPSNSQFVGESTALVQFTYTNSSLGKNENSLSFIPLENPSFQQRMYCESEALKAYSADGKIKAVIKSIKYSKKMPLSITKATEETVSVLEVSNGQRIIAKKILDENNGNFTVHPTISSGLQMSPDCTKLAWIVSDKMKFEHKNEILNFTTKMNDYKDYGEDMDGIYHTSLVVFDTKTNEAKVFGSPEKHGACQFSFASNNVIIIQCVDLSSPRLLGLRSYTNRPFEIFAVKLNEETPKFVRLLGPKRLDPSVYFIDEKSCILFTQKFPDNFGGHNGQAHPEVCKVDLENLTISDHRTHNVAMNLEKRGNNIFLNENEVVLTEGNRTYYTPVVLNLKTFETRELVKRENHESYIVDDVCMKTQSILIRKSSSNMLPQLILLDGKGEMHELTEEYKFDELTTTVETVGNNASLIMLLTKEPKKFVVIPHGGPHGMNSTFFNRTPLIWSLCGYSTVQVNYTGSLGVPLEETKQIIGKAGTIDLEDVVAAVKMIREKYSPEKVYIFGWSHGGFLSSHMAAKHSDIVDGCVIGAPVTNFISSYFSCDIPDWAVVETGLSDESDGEVALTPEVFAKMWDCSPLKYASGINVPVLIVHGSNDRRVCLGQSIELYQYLKRNNKPVKFLQYDGNGHSMLQRDAWDDMMVSSYNFFNDPMTYVSEN